MNQQQAQRIVIEVATKRRPHTRTELDEAVRVLETKEPSTTGKKKVGK